MQLLHCKIAQIMQFYYQKYYCNQVGNHLQLNTITKEEEEQQNQQDDEDSSSDDSSENDEIHTVTDDSDDDQTMKIINNIFYGLENISYDTPDEDK